MATKMRTDAGRESIGSGRRQKGLDRAAKRGGLEVAVDAQRDAARKLEGQTGLAMVGRQSGR